MTEGSEEVNNSTALALIGLVAGFALGLIVAWIAGRQREEQRQDPRPKRMEEERVPLEPGPAATEEATVPVEVAREPEEEAEREPDDLTRIEGIGPKMSSILMEDGTVTFKQLAARDPDALRDMLREEGLPFADPSTWPEQAALAAAGAWDELEALQKELSGGRRVG
jgi:predicted flap endonuclease-1-like 5' DNA nuclease